MPAPLEGGFVTDQGAILRDIILDLVPADGSNIGNQALLALLQDRIPTITEEAYQAARDVLVEEGILGKGRGRGGSIHLAIDEEDEDEDGFALEEVEKGQDSPQNRAKREALKEWVAAVNAVGGFGSWCWDVAFAPAAVHDFIAKHAARGVS